MLELPAIVLICVTVFGYLNHKYLKLPLTVGLVIIALVSGLAVILLDVVFPSMKVSLALNGWLD